MANTSQIPESDEPATPATNGHGIQREGKATAKAKPAGKSTRANNARLQKKRTRTPRPYPVVPFKEATVLADAIFKFAGGQKRFGG